MHALVKVHVTFVLRIRAGLQVHLGVLVRAAYVQCARQNLACYVMRHIQHYGPTAGPGHAK